MVDKCLKTKHGQFWNEILFKLLSFDYCTASNVRPLAGGEQSLQAPTKFCSVLIAIR